MWRFGTSPRHRPTVIAPTGTVAAEPHSRRLSSRTVLAPVGARSGRRSRPRRSVRCRPHGPEPSGRTGVPERRSGRRNRRETYCMGTISRCFSARGSSLAVPTGRSTRASIPAGIGRSESRPDSVVYAAVIGLLGSSTPWRSAETGGRNDASIVGRRSTARPPFMTCTLRFQGCSVDIPHY